MTSKSFSLPNPLSGESATLINVWQHHEKHSSNHPLFQYASGDARGSENLITWGEGTQAMHAAGRVILDSFMKEGGFDPSAVHGERPVIGILAVSDMITAWASITGIIRAGFTVLLLSPRNSPPALAYLLKTTKCRMLVHSTDRLIEDALAATLNLLRESGETPMPLCKLPGFSETYRRQDYVEPLPRNLGVISDDIALILHTSGSTAFPKPRMLSHRSLLQFSNYANNESVGMSGKLLAAHSHPHFHMMGVLTTLGWTSIGGMVMGVFPPVSPPTVPTPQRVLDAAIQSRAVLLFVVPSFLEDWSSDEEAIRKLTSIRTVMFGGGPLKKSVGDALVRKGVNIVTFYGSQVAHTLKTELGSVSTYTEAAPSHGWEYFKIIKYIDAHLIPEGSEGFYELVVTESPLLRPCVFNTTFEGRPAYATGDLLARHPTHPQLWRIVGRKDDQIMHSNGEKTNPGPMESIIMKHPAVGRVVMFGRGQFQPGIIIEPLRELKDDASRNAFLDEIWPSIEEANASAPTHSRIFREMIVLAKPEKPFKVTPKLTLRRSEVLADYADEIGDAYHNFALSSSSVDTISLPVTWDEKDCVGFIHAAVSRVLGHDLEDDHDFFQQGINSLQVAYLRSMIAGALRRAGINAPFEANSIYDFPTVGSLAQFTSKLISGNLAVPVTKDSRASELTTLVEQHIAHLPRHKGTSPLPKKETILVTGTTGSLGINVLRTLVSLDSVHKVYAYNRKDSSGRTPRDRHLSATKLQGISDALVDSPKVVYLEGDITLMNLGLPGDVLRDMRSSLTSILHLAWKVDFNISLKSFRPQLQGVRNLIDLALSSDLEKVPYLVFASSISDLQNLSGQAVVPATVNPDPKTALGMGYGESKWVASRILETAREHTPLRPVIVRIGQLCGNYETGCWNPWEWFPTIVRSAKAIGSLPELEVELSWIPVDIAASTVVDLRDAGDSALVANLVHPAPIEPKIIIEEIARCLHLPVVPYGTWLENLKRVKETTGTNEKKILEEIPALKLLDFYQSLAVASTGGKGSSDVMQVKLDVSQTVELSKTLSSENLHPLNGTNAAKWLKSWNLIMG